MKQTYLQRSSLGQKSKFRQWSTACLSLLMILLNMTTWAQQRTLTGKVTSAEDGSELPGVSILVVGTSNGTQTAADGTYKISVTSGSKLRFTSVGMISQEIDITNQTTLDVTLQPNSQSLSEVVVVGYGTQRKADVTGATATVTSKDFNAGVLNNPLQAVQGKVSGLVISAPNSDPTNNRPTIRLRGTSSLSANSEPLIVIDGVAGAPLNSVAPEDIQSVDVLKDASAAAIYGSRGANGVIIVTTKKGSAGRTSVEYSGYISMGKEVRRPGFLTPDEFRAKLTEQNVTGQDYGASTNWLDQVTRTSWTQNHSVAVSGGAEKFSYRGSLVYLDQPGIIKNSGFNRINARLNLVQKALDDRLEIQLLLSHQTNNKKFVDYGALRSAVRFNPTQPIYNADGTFNQPQGQFEVENPLARLMQLTNEGKERQTLLNAKASYEIVKGLKVGVNASQSTFDYLYGFFIPSYFRGSGNSISRARRETQEVLDRLIESTVNYSNTIDKHNFSVLLGHTYQKVSNEGFGAEHRNFPDAFGYNNLEAGNDNADGSTNRRVNSYKSEAILVGLIGRLNYSYNEKYLLTANIRRDGSSRFGANNRWGWFPSVSAGWRLIEEDFIKSSNLFSDLKLRAGYGVTGNQDGIADYAARRLYGSQGSYYTNGGFQTAYFYSQNPNPDLKWETSAMTNVGVDFGFMKGRLTGSLEFYYKDTRDLLFNYPVAIGSRYGSQQIVAGTNNVLANVGRVTNKGVELALDFQAISKQDFEWRTTLNLAHNTNKIVSLSNDLFQYNSNSPLLYGSFGSGQGGIASPIVLQEGYAIGTFYGPRVTGFNDRGEYIYQDFGGGGTQPAGADRTYLGNAQPKLTLGWQNNFTYKNWDLSFFFRGSLGQKVANGMYIYFANPNRFPGENLLKDAFTTGIGKGVSSAWSDLWLEDASFVRLDNFRLGYRIPGLKKVLQNAQVYVSGQNIFVITKYRGADPEVRTGDSRSQYGSISDDNRAVNLSPGVDPVSYYPRARTLVAGVSLTF